MPTFVESMIKYSRNGTTPNTFLTDCIIVFGLASLSFSASWLATEGGVGGASENTKI